MRARRLKTVFILIITFAMLYSIFNVYAYDDVYIESRMTNRVELDSIVSKESEWFLSSPLEKPIVPDTLLSEYGATINQWKLLRANMTRLTIRVLDIWKSSWQEEDNTTPSIWFNMDASWRIPYRKLLSEGDQIVFEDISFNHIEILVLDEDSLDVVFEQIYFYMESENQTSDSWLYVTLQIEERWDFYWLGWSWECGGVLPIDDVIFDWYIFFGILGLVAVVVVICGMGLIGIWFIRHMKTFIIPEYIQSEESSATKNKDAK